MRPKHPLLRAGICRLAFALLAANAGAAESAKKTFNVPAGNAEATLREFSKQAGVQIVFDVDKVSGVRTAVVQGDYEPREALSRMFVRTGLVAVQDEKTGSLTVRREKPPPNAAKNGSRAAPATASDRP